MAPSTDRRSTRPGLLGLGSHLLVAGALASLPGAAAGLSAQPFDQTYDVIIANGRVLDGTGNPWYQADVGIRGDRIAAVGDLSTSVAEVVVDADGLYVAPGFIDVHSHAAGGLASPELSHARPLLAQGLTTVFVNPDGGGWVDLAAQRDSLEKDRLGVNVAQLVPHGSIRGDVLGMDDRAPTEAELERMRALVRQGMEYGAFGMSSGPFYAPGSFSETAELVELAQVVGEFGGAYTSHIRDESNYTIGVTAAVDEVITVAREAGIPGVVTHVKALGPPVWGYSTAIVRRVERARAEGVEVYADQYPYPASSTSLSAAIVPRWAQGGGDDAFQERLDDDETRDRIVQEMWENLARRGGADRIQFRQDREEVALAGRTLADVADQWEVDPIEATLRLLEDGSPGIVSFNMHEDDVRTLMRQPWTMTSSDGGLGPMGEGVPHPRNYGAFPRKIRTYVVEEGVVELHDAVRSMTGLPAQVFRLRDRGVLRAGAFADVVVFDLERMRDLATFTEPHQLAEGVVDLWVNGERAIEAGEFTGRLAGDVLRRERPPAPPPIGGGEGSPRSAAGHPEATGAEAVDPTGRGAR